jgi:uncharacterized protein HemY
LKQASAQRKDDPELLYYLGEVHHQLKQWDECKGLLQRALTLNLSPGLSDDAKRALADCSEPALGNSHDRPERAVPMILFELEQGVSRPRS